MVMKIVEIFQIKVSHLNMPHKNAGNSNHLLCTKVVPQILWEPA